MQNLIVDLLNTNQFHEAKKKLEEWLTESPHDSRPHRLLGRALVNLGEYDAALVAIDKAISLDKNSGAVIERALLVPPILESSEHIEQIRTQMLCKIEELEQCNIKLNDSVEDIITTNFYLAYQGINDRPLQQRIARLFLKFYPELNWTAEHCSTPDLDSGRKIRVGFCSNNFRTNSVGLFYLKLFQGLNPARFELFLYRAPQGSPDKVTERYESVALSSCTLSSNLSQARQQIARSQLDILFYPDLTVHPLINYLSFARLAPVQITSIGHPVTSGVPNMDYFFSSRLMEPENAKDHYSEQLIHLSGFPSFYCPPKLIQSPIRRSFFQLPDDKRIYCCGHQAFKLHPKFDSILGNILRQDQKSVILLINAWGNPEQGSLLLERIQASCSDVAGRILMKDRLSYIQYLALVQLVDVHLDPIYFGGGRTTFDILSLGKTIVTWPGPHQRGRLTAACFKLMEISDCVVDNFDEYVERVIELGINNRRRKFLEGEIRKRASVLFDHECVLEEIEGFFIDSVTSWKEKRGQVSRAVQC